MRKKLLSILLATVLATSFCPVAYAAPAADGALQGAQGAEQVQSENTGASSDAKDGQSAADAANAGVVDDGAASADVANAGAADAEAADANAENAGEADQAANGVSAQSADATDGEVALQGETIERFIEEGTYLISSRLLSSSVLDVANGQFSNGANIQLWRSNMSKAQNFELTYDEKGYATFTVEGTNLCLDVYGANKNNGTNVHLWQANGTKAQKWVIEQRPSGYYAIRSALSTAENPIVLDVSSGNSANGTNIHVWESNGTNAQRFQFINTKVNVEAGDKVVKDGLYNVAITKNNRRYLDIYCASTESGAAAQLYSPNGTAAQKFYFKRGNDGFYTITNLASGKVLDVSCAGLVERTAIQQWTSNGTDAQKWRIDQNDDGTFTIISKVNGLALGFEGEDYFSRCRCFASSSDNNTHLVLTTAIYDRTVEDGEYVISLRKNSGKVLDVSGASTQSGANVQLWSSNGTDAQVFQVTFDKKTGTYSIVNKASGKSLDAYAGVMGNGTNIHQWSSNGTLAQSWVINRFGDSMQIASAKDPSFCLDISGGSTSDGANVQLWTSNGTNAQRFKFIPAATAMAQSFGTMKVVCTDAKGNTQTVKSSKMGDGTYIFLPAFASFDNIELNFGEDGAGAYLSTDGKENTMLIKSGVAFDLKNSSFSPNADGNYTVYLKTKSGNHVEQIHFMKSANVGTVFVTSSDPTNKGRAYIESSPDHSLKASGSVAIIESNGAVTYNGGMSEIKGRGNSTWEGDKKAYQFKTDSKVSLIDGTKENKSKTWVLLANRYDQSGLRNYVGLKSAIAVGLGVTPDCRFVDLYYDGEYRGTYQLAEKVQVKEGRVDITDLGDKNTAMEGTSSDLSTHDTVRGWHNGYEYQYVSGVQAPADITGGYLVELDQAYYADERCWFQTSAGYFVLKTPEDASQSEVLYIMDTMQKAIDSCSGSYMHKYFDMDSLVKTHLVELYSQNSDYAMYSSTYFYKPSAADAGYDSSKIYAGPVWDFDLAFGNHAAQGSANDAGSPAKAFYAKNKAFKTALSEAFNTYSSSLISDVKDVRAEIAKSRAMDAILWSIDATDNGYRFYINTPQSLTAGGQYLDSWLLQRMSWLRSQLSK